MYQYFWSILQNAEVWLHKVQNQSEPKVSKRNIGILCKCHIFSQTSINVNWEIQQASMLCKPNTSSQICCIKVWLDELLNMLELVQWGFFYPEISRRTCHPVILLMDNAPGHFEAFQREKVVLRIFTLNVTRWQQPCDLEVIVAVKKRYFSCIWKMYCHSISLTVTANSY